MSDDPYAALGVAKTATQDEIRKAYKKIAKESHPDLNPGDPKAAERFKAASTAHDLLKDPEQRARFDRGEIDASGQERPVRPVLPRVRRGPRGDLPHQPRLRGLRRFLRRLRRPVRPTRPVGAGVRGLPARGPDAHYTLEVGFLEAARGATRRITLPRGDVLDVKIPEGLADGQTIRLRGKGGAGFGGGPPGDALVTVTVAPHAFFRREGDDIVAELPITLDEAVLGGKVEVPTIDGRVALTIPKGASSGQVLRLRGKGVKHGGKRGDQRVTLKIVAPPAVDDELEAFFLRWREAHAYDPRKGVVP